VNLACHDGSLFGPIPINGYSPLLQYVDDTIIILPADKDQLVVFKSIMDEYATFTLRMVN
jgi:hypothetical protein